jgi:hypothetical protein
MRWAEHVARIGERRIAYRGCVVKPEGTRPLDDLGADEDNIKRDLQET